MTKSYLQITAISHYRNSYSIPLSVIEESRQSGETDEQVAQRLLDNNSNKVAWVSNAEISEDVVGSTVLTEPQLIDYIQSDAFSTLTDTTAQNILTTVNKN